MGVQLKDFAALLVFFGCSACHEGGAGRVIASVSL